MNGPMNSAGTSQVMRELALIHETANHRGERGESPRSVGVVFIVLFGVIGEVRN